MNTLSRTLSRVVAVAVILMAPFSSFAATDIPASAPAFIYPTLTAQALHLDKEAYASGDVVSGTFLLINSGKATIPNGGYVVRVVGNFTQGNLWTAEYARQTIQDLALAPGESRTVPVSIALPAGLTGDLGIEVQAQLSSGTFLGWSDARIKVSGTNTFVAVTNPYITVGNSEFDIAEGPTIHEGETGDLAVTLSNETDAALTLTPSIVLTKQGEDAGKRSSEKVAVPAHGTADVHLSVAPTDAPGVYTADISFVDGAGKPHTQMLTYRYIIAGNTATIQSVSADKVRAHTRETVTVTTLFTGNPPDINPLKGSTLESQASTTLSVVLFSERGTRVGSASKEVDLSKERTAVLSIPVTAPSNAFRAEVTLSRDGKTLAELDTPLSSQYGYYSTRAMIVSYVLYALIALFAIGGVLLFIRARRATVPNTKERIAAIVSIALAVLGVVLAVLVYMGVFALVGLPTLPATPVAHAEGGYCGLMAQNGVCTPDCGCDPGAVGDPNVYVNPDVCPADDGIQTEGPCEHVIMNLNYVSDPGRWDYYIRNYLPYWQKSNLGTPGGVWLYFSKTILPQPNLPIIDFGDLWGGLLWQSTTSYQGTPYNQYLNATASDPSTIYANVNGLVGGSRPSVYVQSIVGPITPGGHFTVDGYVNYQECTNTPIDMTLGADFQGTSFITTFPSTVSGTAHTVYPSQARFSFGQFTAPTEPGTYRLYFNMGWKYKHFQPDPSYQIPFGSSAPGHIDIVVTAINDLVPGTLAPTTAVLDVPTTVSIPINNIKPDAAGVSTTYFGIAGPDLHYETVHVPEASGECHTNKEGATNCDVIPEHDEQQQFGFTDAQYIATAAVSGSGTRTASFPYTFHQLGTYTFSICADQWNQVSEFNESNNCTTGTVVVSSAVAAVSCTVSNQSPAIGESVTYTATPAAGATGPYAWHPSDSVTGLGSASTATRSFSAGGSYGMSVSATGASADGFCPTVTVAGAACSNPSGSLTASPSRVKPNVATSVTFNYGATGANTCTLSGSGIATQTYTATACTVSPGTFTTSLTIATQGVYSLTCDGVTTKTVVNVIPAFDEF